MEAQSLIALDTDHIKSYVFATDTLKEIRGASSLLDRLNRNVMEKEAKRLDGETIYANGGSGLFLIDSNKAEEFATRVQQEYQRLTAGGATVTYVIQELPEGAPQTREAIMTYRMPHTLALLRYRLRQRKDNPDTYTTEVSHPLMRPCDSCGTYYAATYARGEQAFYCQVCQNKRQEDDDVKRYITTWIKIQNPRKNFESPLWKTVLSRLNHYNYRLTDDDDNDVKRPEDLNVFREFRQAKDYLGLIYADANGMGRKIEDLKTLLEIQEFALNIDKAVYWAMCDVIQDQLPVKKGIDGLVFPFDILLIGGDDLVFVAPAAQAMSVAHALAKQFYKFANQDKSANDNQDEQAKDKEKKECGDGTKEAEKHSLSIGVVLAPTNYPFSLLRKLAESTLKFAKKDGSKRIEKKKSEYDKTRINFLVVAGSTSHDFDKVYKQLYKKRKTDSFYATMRPYTVEQLEFLLKRLKEGNKYALGRSKLHQLREAVLQLNRSTSVTESLALLRTWKADERDFMVKEVYNPLTQWDEAESSGKFSRCHLSLGD